MRIHLSFENLGSQFLSGLNVFRIKKLLLFIPGLEK
ncbi:hypothetical protein PM8797T_23961 [Gimesia maris DSM 8797]|nr:hypothetical protein PM8797T_23961 [Gimesia maris DSM 8797]